MSTIDKNKYSKDYKNNHKISTEYPTPKTISDDMSYEKSNKIADDKIIKIWLRNQPQKLIMKTIKLN